jgi:hypothetical protein
VPNIAISITHNTFANMVLARNTDLLGGTRLAMVSYVSRCQLSAGSHEVDYER